MKKLIMILFIINVSFASNETALAAIENAERGVDELQKLGFGFISANDTLHEAKLLFDAGAFDRAETTANSSIAIKEKAVKVNNLLDPTEIRIYELSLETDTLAIQKDFDAAVNAFNIEDFNTAERIIEDVIDGLDKKESEISLQKALVASKGIDIAGFVKENLIIIIPSLIVFGILSAAVFKKFNVIRTRNKVENIKNEKEVVQNLIKGLQKRYYEEGNISKGEYKISITMYKKRLNTLDKDLSVLKKKLEK